MTESTVLCLVLGVLWLLAEVRGILGRAEAARERGDLMNRLMARTPGEYVALRAIEEAPREAAPLLGISGPAVSQPGPEGMVDESYLGLYSTVEAGIAEFQ